MRSRGVAAEAAALPVAPGTVPAGEDYLDLFALGGFEDVFGVVERVGVERHVAHLGDGEGVFERVGRAVENTRHLGAAFEVELLRGVAHALGVGDLRAGLDAQQRVVRGDVPVVNVVHVVRAHDAQAVGGGEFEQLPVQVHLLGQPVVHDFDDEIFLAEDVEKAGERALGAVGFAGGERPWNHAAHAAGEADETAGVGGELLHVGARLAVERAAQVRVRDDFDEVLVAGEILGEQPHVVALLGGAVGTLRERVVEDEVDFAPQQRLDFSAPRLGEHLRVAPKLEQPEERAVVGDGDGALTERVGAFEQLFGARAPVEQTVIAVHVQVDELRRHLCERLGGNVVKRGAENAAGTGNRAGVSTGATGALGGVGGGVHVVFRRRRRCV